MFGKSLYSEFNRDEYFNSLSTDVEYYYYSEKTLPLKTLTTLHSCRLLRTKTFPTANPLENIVVCLLYHPMHYLFTVTFSTYGNIGTPSYMFLRIFYPSVATFKQFRATLKNLTNIKKFFSDVCNFELGKIKMARKIHEDIRATTLKALKNTTPPTQLSESEIDSIITADEEVFNSYHRPPTQE